MTQNVEDIMTAPLAVSSGPAESRSVRTVFYLAEGAVAGAIFFFVMYLLSFLLSLFEVVTGSSRWFIVLILSILLGIGVRSVWATVLVRQSSSLPTVYREWTEVRRWPWVTVVAVAIAAGLFGILLLIWGWEWGTYAPSAPWLAMGTLLFGFALLAVAGGRGTKHD